MGCGISTEAQTEAEAESMRILHIKLVHLDDLLAERALKMNSIQKKQMII